MARLTVTSYAVGGVGPGQVQRQIAVVRWLKRYAAQLGDVVEPYFVTSTEADNVLFAEGMASFKLPSMAAAQAAELDRRRYLALAKQWVWHSLGLLQPDVLIVETWPRGAYGELLNALDLCRKRVFIFGPEARAHADKADFQAMLPLYDLILVPAREGAYDLPFGDVQPDRIRWLGPILPRERIELPERWEARERLGAAADRFVLFVTAGSGVDVQARETLLSICTALLDVPDTHLVVDGGPLHFGSFLQGPRVTWLNGPSAELVRGFDAAICAGSRAALDELLFAGVPVAWIPMSAFGDDSSASAPPAEATEGVMVLDPDDVRGSVILDALEKLRAPDFRAGCAEALQRGGLVNRARDAAQAILSLIHPLAEVQRAALAVGDRVLQAAAALAQPAHAVIAFARWLSREPRPSPEATKAACALTDAMLAHALHPPLGSEVVEPLCVKLPMDAPGRRAQMVISLLDALACFEDWGEVVAFVEALTPEADLPLDRFAALLQALFEAGRDQGMSLRDLADALTATRRDVAGQGEAIEALLASLGECGQPRRVSS